jgi:thiopeptide-type bacteriocin biosynthesis protein
MPTPSKSSLLLSIDAPRDEHDTVLRSWITPIVRELASSSALDAAYFERFNKPAWGIRLHVLGAHEWLHGRARETIERSLATLGARYAFVDDEAEDKWVGGSHDRRDLERISWLDTVACLDLLEAQAAGALATSRGQWSLFVVEGLLDSFGLHGDDRLEFYRRGFQWAPDLGRWDAEVFAALEQKFEKQKGQLRDALASRAKDMPAESWGGPEPGRIAMTLLEQAREAIAALLAAATKGRISKPPLDWAVLSCHAHSNRLGIHATQEATIRYLVWRARGGPRPAAS